MLGNKGAPGCAPRCPLPALASLAAQFKKGKKRAKAHDEAQALYLAGPNSALCIALAKMHMTLAVEQVPPPAAAAAAAACAPLCHERRCVNTHLYALGM